MSRDVLLAATNRRGKVSNRRLTGAKLIKQLDPHRLADDPKPLRDQLHQGVWKRMRCEGLRVVRRRHDLLFYHCMIVDANSGGLDEATRVDVYGSSCPACVQAKQVLTRFGVRYHEHPMSALPRRHGAVRSMPQITIDDQLLGGLNQLLGLARNGGLERIARDDRTPWVKVSRRIGRGYQVVLLDRCGRAVMTRRAPTRTEAARIAGTMARAAQESA